MKYKKTIIPLVLVIFLLGIVSVNASEIDNTISNEDNTSIDLSSDKDITDDNLETNEKKTELTLTDNETLSAQTDTDILNANSAKYSDLAKEIKQPGNIKLTYKNYIYDDGATAITIKENNKVIDGDGAVIDMKGSTIQAFYVSASGVTIKNLIIKNANSNGDGGAIYFKSSGTVTNCEFNNNTAKYGGAIMMTSGTVTDCRFVANKAKNTMFSYGGAVYFNNGEGTVINCYFAENSAGYNGGAIMMASGTVTNCNFLNNTASCDGGAILSGGEADVKKCYFADNKAGHDGGAITFLDEGKVTNCRFTGNTAKYGAGAINFGDTGNVTNCNFTNNTAKKNGGAIYFYMGGNVTSCNFAGNIASTGSAIYFYKYSSNTLSISNSCFLNNKANAQDLDIIKNDNNITITFTGENNLLNAIYSRNDAEVTFTNVKYWGKNGIETISSTISGSNKEAGQNITIKGVVNGNILNTICMTDDEGKVVLNDIVGDYLVVVRHDTDSYYTEAERTITNRVFHVNITSQTTTNKTVNITAKSNIPNDIVQGKLLFILPNGTQITTTYCTDGTWWSEHAFDQYGNYQITASYVGLNNVTVNNGTINIIKTNSKITLDNIVLDYGEFINLTVSTSGADGITANIDGINVTVINNYSIQIFGLNAGNHTLTVTTIADRDHNPVTKTANITVNKIPTELTGNAITATYNDNKYLVITLKNSAGNALSDTTVVVDLNGAKTYTTNKNGQVKVSTKGLTPKQYAVKVTFNGNDNYIKSNKEIKVTVKKATPKLTAKKKTFKKSVKVKKYTIVLKDNLGKAINKAKVTIKVGKKTYTAKTNTKGKATFKIKKLTKKGTYKSTITYKGNAYYNKVTKKVKIKLK